MKKRIDRVSKESFPLVLRMGGVLFTLGGMIAGCMSLGLAGIKSFFHIKSRVEKDVLRQRYVELKIKSNERRSRC
jgi:hypothetical protein